MLKLWIGDPEGIDYVYSVKEFFNAEYEESWLMEPLMKDMIKDVDQSEVVSGHLIMSPILGAIPPQTLSDGVKTLIMASHDFSRIYNLTSCGDNCAKWIIRLAKDKDITMRLNHIMDFTDVEDLEVMFMNTNKIVTSVREFNRELSDIFDMIGGH